MRGEARAWASRHGRAIAAASVAAALVTAGSVARCAAVHAPAEAAERTPQELADLRLDEGLKALRASYDDVTKEAIALLAANVWVDADGATVVTLTDRALRVRARGADEWLAYAVTASARRDAPTGGAPARETTLCVETPEWRELATLTVPAATGDGPAAPATLRCAGIAGGAELSLSPALKDVEADGPGDELLAPRGTDLAGVRAALAAWCGAWRPTATTATWDRAIVEDHDRRAWLLGYRLDDRRATTVTVAIPMAAGEAISVEEGGR